MMIEKHPYLARIKDTSGASIVIALVFFLICGIVGSVVVTAASVQAKSVQTHADMRQDEYWVQSAAELVAQQLGGKANGSIDDPDAKPSVTIAAITGGTSVTADTSQVYSDMGMAFWTKARADKLFGKDPSALETITITPPSGGASTDPASGTVYGQISVDKDRNMTVLLSLDEHFAASSPYNMTVSIQCTPTYDAGGKLTAISYGDNTTIEKAS